MALVRCSVGKAVAGALLATALAGCSGTGTSQARDENQKMDCLTRCGEELERKSARPVLVARSQMPEVLPPVRLGDPVAAPSPKSTTTDTEPALDIRAPAVVAPQTSQMPVAPGEIRPAAATDASPTSAAPRLEGDRQVRVVASIGQNPIYESEVREAVYQRMGELLRLPDSQRVLREKEIFREELRKIIERELVLDEMTARLTAKKMNGQLTKLKEAAAKEADARLKEFKKERGIPTDAEFRDVLRSQGLTLAGIKRQIERGFMMQTYLRDALSGKFDALGLADLREYYAAHPDEFRDEDRVKWQDLFASKERFRSVAEAKQYAEHFAARAARGEDLGKLAAENSMGDSKFRNGAGIGEKPGEIFPQELESTILALRPGQVTIKETETGFHVLRVTERTYRGPKPYDEKLQAEIRRKLQAQIFDREAKRMIETLWKRTQPQIWVEG